jgi:hypothetical protein
MTTTIADDWRCHALEPRNDHGWDYRLLPMDRVRRAGHQTMKGHRCEAVGVRYRDGGQWVCARHFDELANRYVGQRPALEEPWPW